MATREQRKVADDVTDLCNEDRDLASGLVCMLCGTCWNKVHGLWRLADVDCPACGALYADVAWNSEP